MAVPLAIVIAGGLIAGALYFALRDNGPVAPTAQQPQVAEPISGIKADDHVRGNPDGDIIIVEYSDPECPFCQAFHDTLKQVMDNYGDRVAWVYRHFPILSLHSKAQIEAEALECAAELGGEDVFWSYTDRVYEVTPANNGLDIGDYNTSSDPDGTDAGQLTDIAVEMGLNAAAFESCIDSRRHQDRIQRDYDEVIAAGGRGTPHNILLIDDEQVPVEGYQRYEPFSSFLDQVLAN